MSELYFEKYNYYIHAEKLNNWQYDEGSFPDSVESCKKFGDVNELMCTYSHIENDREKLEPLVIYNKNHRDIGVVILDHVMYDYDNGKTSLSALYLIIRPDEQGKGYGTAITKYIIQNGENIMGRPVDEFCASVHITNRPSHKVMENLGISPLLTYGDYVIYSLPLERERGNDEKNI